MGAYVNADGMSNEEWLSKNGKRLHSVSRGDFDFRDKLPVCLVDNIVFQAAGIAFDEKEFDVFNNNNDNRPKKWFLVDKELLKTVSPELSRYLGDG